MNNLTTFQAIGKTISMLMLSAAALLFSFAALTYSTSPATADAAPSTITDYGRYDMQFASVFGNESTFWYILVWDTSSGRSKMYYGSTNTKNITTAGGSYQLPSSPL